MKACGEWGNLKFGDTAARIGLSIPEHVYFCGTVHTVSNSV